LSQHPFEPCTFFQYFALLNLCALRLQLLLVTLCLTLVFFAFFFLNPSTPPRTFLFFFFLYSFRVDAAHREAPALRVQLSYEKAPYPGRARSLVFVVIKKKRENSSPCRLRHTSRPTRFGVLCSVSPAAGSLCCFDLKKKKKKY
jgi:hypothetical protein